MPVITATAGLILGSLFSGLFSYMSADEQNEALSEAQEEARLLEEQRIKMLERQQAQNEKMDKYGMEWNEKKFAYQKSEGRKDRRERAEERGYQRREGHFNKTMSLLNTNQALKSNTLGFLKRGQ
jgi:hypothetical protein